MANNDRRSFEYCREAVYGRLRRYTAALDDPDDRVIAALARTELPRYVQYWVELLAKHEPTDRGSCPLCSRWWRPAGVPCDTWKWARGFLTVTPARATVPASRMHDGNSDGTQHARPVVP